MIDKHTEHIYNIILSIVLGVLVVLFINQLFVSPQVIKVDKND